MNFFVGIDGGGTKTKAVLIDENLNIIQEGVGGPSNFLVFDINDVAHSIIELLTTLTNEANISLSDIQSILIGTAGAGRREDAERLENSVLKEMQNRNIKTNNFRVESDARIALEGAFAGKPGSILIAGTGSIMFGKDLNDNIHRVGGFGRILGDEGSGFHIGQAGLNAVAKSFDGRNNGTILTKLLKDNFNINNSVQLINEVYKNNFDIPKVAPLVIEAAEQNDLICRNILDSEIDELIEHISAMKEKINEDVLSISLIGGTISTNNYYANLFRKRVENISAVQIVAAKLNPQMGAALMAKKYFSNR
ncbi:MAG: hypothetical protein L3J41_00215 [Melioribacteraceae bacterium]|nr:hypothetical protein [Melioribacteraceae bacterium]